MQVITFFQLVNKTKMSAAVVSMAVAEDWLAVGTYDRVITIIDTAAFDSNIAQLRVRLLITILAYL